MPTFVGGHGVVLGARFVIGMQAGIPSCPACSGLESLGGRPIHFARSNSPSMSNSAAVSLVEASISTLFVPSQVS